MEKRKPGRQSYKDKILGNLGLIKKMRREGFTVVQVGKALGMSFNTLYKYAEKYPEIRLAIDADKEIHQLELEKSLIYHATKKFDTKYKWIPHNGKYGNIEDYPDEDKKKVGPAWFIRIPVEDIPFTPNSSMLSFALKNHDKHKWVDRVENEITVEKDESIEAIHDLIDTLKDE